MFSFCVQHVQVFLVARSFLGFPQTSKGVTGLLRYLLSFQLPLKSHDSCWSLDGRSPLNCTVIPQWSCLRFSPCSLSEVSIQRPRDGDEYGVYRYGTSASLGGVDEEHSFPSCIAGSSSLSGLVRQTHKFQALLLIYNSHYQRSETPLGEKTSWICMTLAHKLQRRRCWGSGFSFFASNAFFVQNLLRHMWKWWDMQVNFSLLARRCSFVWQRTVGTTKSWSWSWLQGKKTCSSRVQEHRYTHNMSE